MQTMRAARIVAPGRAEVVTAPVPEPARGQVRIAVLGCGVCGSNVGPWEGHEWFQYPLPAGEGGHEVWGRVDATGEGVSGIETGSRTLALCGRGFAEYAIADANSLVPISGGSDGEPFPGEAVACAWNVFRRSRIEAGQTVAVVGIGFLGAIVVRLADLAGARVIAISRRPWALELATSLGADETVVLEDRKVTASRVAELTGGRMCERVVEAVGRQEPLDLASEITAEHGLLAIAGYHQDGPRRVDMQLWNWRGIDVVNAHERRPERYVEGMRWAADAVGTGLLDLSRLVTHRYPLAEFGDALRATQTRPDGFLKAWVTP